MMYKKACIITNYYKTINYGAILQAYALNLYINRIGVHAETLAYPSEKESRKEVVFDLLEHDPHRLFSAVKTKILRQVIKKYLNRRRHEIDLFRNSIPHTDECTYREVLKTILISNHKVTLCAYQASCIRSSCVGSWFL